MIFFARGSSRQFSLPKWPIVQVRKVSTDRPFDKILIANRGEIACRVIKTCKKMGIKTVAVYSDADVNSLHVRMADEAFNVGPPPTNKSYLDIGKIVEAVKKSGAQAVHPGYGFLSENSHFVHALDAIGVTFIGPSEASMAVMGDKIQSKRTAKEAGVNTVPGYDGPAESLEHAIKIAGDIGYPVMIKASHGGGGKGMRICWNEEEVRQNYKVAKSEALSSFGDDSLLVEKFIDNPRHIEIQLIGDQHGNTFYLPERECSIQRRNQKVIEEAPSTHIDQKTREAMGQQAVQLAKKVGYFSAGTVEFLADAQKNFYFLEMNTRLQVEHPITEYITGLDLVELMIRVAAGQKLNLDQNIVNKPKGWALESRVYAEDPTKFLPSIGRLNTYIEPKGGNEIRCDSGIVEGSEISVYYDPMICKLCTYGKDRTEALYHMTKALDSYVIKGVTHNISLLREVINHPRFVSGKISTKFLGEEYPTGFTGHQLTKEERIRLLSLTGWVHAHRDIRNHCWLHTQLPVPRSWDLAITMDKETEPHNVQVFLEESGDFTAVVDKERFDVTADWKVESPLIKGYVNDDEVIAQYLEPLPLGFKMSYMGTKFDMIVRSQEQQELSKYMKPKAHLDLAKMILSPMPGVVVSLSVKKGDIITEGAEVAIVEAMKMQNVLRAQAAGRVKDVRVKDGASVQANEILVELEEYELQK